MAVGDAVNNKKKLCTLIFSCRSTRARSPKLASQLSQGTPNILILKAAKFRFFLEKSVYKTTTTEIVVKKLHFNTISFNKVSVVLS